MTTKIDPNKGYTLEEAGALFTTAVKSAKIKTRISKKESLKLDAIRKLKEVYGIKPGDTIHCILRSVSRSGMNRKISLIYKGENISYYVADIFQEKPKEINGHWALNVGGCGMDMGFHCVYRLGRHLFPNGFIPAEAGHKCGRNGTPSTDLDDDGGYALEYRWL